MKKILKETKVLKTRILSVFLALLTVSVTILSPLLSPIKVHAFEEYPEEILVDLDMAQSSLDELLSQKEVYALVYLCDAFDLKSAPDTQSDTIVSLNSGHYVQITGVTQDDNYYIWYEIQADVAGNLYTGYILRDYLAYSDEDLLNWEYDNVMSLSFSLFSLAPVAEEDLNTVTIPEDIRQFPESYQDALMALKERHPNWNFVRMNTNLDWNYVVTEENKGDRSLIRSSNPSYLKKGEYDSAWSYPTNGFLAHYIDPRCFLTEDYIFQFESLFYNETYHTEEAVQSILSNTFMNGAIPGDENGLTYAQAFYQIGSQLKVSPFHLAARVRQEQGSEGTSALISGTHETYPGVYNYFNVGASGAGTTAVVNSGLKYATNANWTTRYASLLGGSKIIADNYISTGQYTLYLQKFDVSTQNGNTPFIHQYMQAIGAPANEATSIRTSYASTYSLDKPFTFSIPVYNNMPENPCPIPNAAKELILGKTSYTLKADETAQMTFCLDGLVTNASAITFSSSNPDVASVSLQGIITAGNAGTATITCTAEGAEPVICNVTVNKTTPVITIPEINAITYSPDQTLADVILPEGWTWDNASITPTVDNAGYPATYTPSNTNKYEVTQTTLSITVNKGTPKFEIPEGLEAVEGNVLGSLKLPVGFTWADATVILEETDSYPATYNPDEGNYETVTGIMIPITVTPLNVECTEHSYGEWTINIEATCGVQGEKIRYCSACLATETEEISALEHNYISTVIKEPTEEEEGTRSYVCKYCEDSYAESIDKLPASHKHSYNESVTTSATCNIAGVKTYTCSCGDSYTEPIPALKHSYNSVVTKEPTEQEEGIRTYTCSHCNDSYTEGIDKLPETHKHNYIESIIKQPTCLEKGTKSYTCSCNDSYTEEITALGHDMADGKCRRCAYTEVTEDNITTPPTTNTPSTSTSTNTSTNTNTNTNTSTNANTNVNTNTTAPATNVSSTTNTASNTTTSTNTDKTTNTTNNTNSNTNNNNSSESVNSDHLVATLNMEKNTILYEDTLSVVNGQDVEVILQMSEQIHWTIQGSNINSESIAGIDMGVTLNNKVIPTDIIKQAAKLSEISSVIEVSLSHDGPIEFSPVLTIETNKANAGRMATLFYFNPQTAVLEFRDEVTIAEDGSISFTFNHASDYAIVISESSISSVTTITSTDVLDVNTPSNEGLQHEETVDISANNNGHIESVMILTKDFTPTTFIIVIAALLFVVFIGIVMFIMSHRKTSRPSFNDDEECEEYINTDNSDVYYENYNDDYDDNYDLEYSDDYAYDYPDDYADSANDN